MNPLIFRGPSQTRDSGIASRTVSYLNGRAGRIAALLFLLTLGVARYASAAGSNSSSISGTVLDPSGAVVGGATVTIYNPVSGFTRTATTDSSGEFSITNVPFNPYHLTVSATGFAEYAQDVDVSSAVPISLKVALQLSGGLTSVTVTSEASDLIEVDPTTHTDVDRALFDKLPLESQSSSISSLITLSTPGIAADSNGLFHGMGDHAENSFNVDGQPITDQQSKIFSNQISLDSLQSLEVIPGAPPAEFGDKTSVVIVATTRSGLGQTQPHGDVKASYGTFGTSNAGFDFGYGGERWGNFISANGLNTTRFLDGPEFNAMHDRGNEENLFDRFDFKPSEKDTVNLNFQFTRSWFQTPNSYDAQYGTAWNGLVVANNGLSPTGVVVGSTDQRSQIKTLDIAPAWTRLVNANTLFTLGGWVRQDRYNYYPSGDPFADLQPGIQLQTIGQTRRLTNAGGRAEVSFAKGINNLKAGVVFQHTFLTEDDSFGVVDPTANAPCLNADGSPFTSPGLTDPANCGESLQQNVGQGSVPAFIPILACYDLTRTAPLPPSAGCPNATSGLYAYKVHSDIKELALFVQDSISKGNWNFNLGLRGDFYNGITIARQAEPRVGAAYNLKKTSTVLQASYARIMETPFNENLILASNACTDAVINALESASSPCVSTSPLSPGTRNEFHLGLQQAFSKYLVVNAEYIWKYTQRGFDFSILGNSPITFPVEWAKSKIPGYALRASVPNIHGFTAFVVMSSVAARFFGPQVAGVGAAPGGSQVFRIDHDERFNETTHLQYQPFKRGPWVGFNWRYDSGLVAGPIPCAGGNCANGPNGTDSIVDASMITPDQQFQAGLSCAGVFATPTTPLSPNSLCPANQYASKYVTIPAAGTENDDHNPPRIAPRNLFDLAVGQDNLFRGDRYKWSLRLSAINLTNKEALYNFISTFSGTHYVTPRALTVELAFHF